MLIIIGNIIAKIGCTDCSISACTRPLSNIILQYQNLNSILLYVSVPELYRAQIFMCTVHDKISDLLLDNIFHYVTREIVMLRSGFICWSKATNSLYTALRSARFNCQL
jgi:hypothetical protein